MGIFENMDRDMKEEQVDYHISYWKLILGIIGAILLAKVFPTIASIMWALFIIGCVVSVVRDK